MDSYGYIPWIFMNSMDIYLGNEFELFDKQLLLVCAAMVNLDNFRQHSMYK